MDDRTGRVGAGVSRTGDGAYTYAKRLGAVPVYFIRKPFAEPESRQVGRKFADPTNKTVWEI